MQLNTQLNQRGVTLQTVILAGVLTLAATGLGIVLYNLIADRSGDIENAAVDTDFLEPIGFEPRPLVPIPDGGGGIAPLPDLGISPRPAGDETDEEDSETDEEDDIFDGLKYSHTLAIQAEQAPSFSCAVHLDGTISCWGQGDSGQLGDGNFYKPGSNKPVKVQGINDAVAVSLGYTHACALHQDETISCWGEGFPNVLGNTFRHNFNKPLKIMDSQGNPRTGFAQVDAGARYTCARYIESHPKAGHITCWGHNLWGNLGNKKDDRGYRSSDYTGIESNPNILSPTTPDEIFVEVFGINDAVDLSAGINHACALHRDKSVSCWGYGITGALGEGLREIRNYPVKVVDSNGRVIRDFDKMAINHSPSTTCGLRGGEGFLWCWGSIGPFLSSVSQRATPVRMSDFEGLEKLAEVKDFALGDSECVVLASDESVWCYGAVRFPSDVSPNHFDVYHYRKLKQIPDIQSPLDIVASSGFICFLLADNTVFCGIGNNIFGQLAEGHRIEDVMALGT